jgi:hypothetical protein
MAWHDKDHPVWNLATIALTTVVKPVILTAALAAFLYFTAESFDETEGKTLAGFLAASVGVEGFGKFFGKGA